MLVNYKNIGDTLSDSELNAYAFLLANKKILTENFKLKNGTIIGDYGEYTFDISTASIVDNGILITEETLSSNITVELSNPTQYATYTLHFTVIRYNDTHLMDETDENIETFDLSVDLVKDTAIVIPMTDLQEYDIILFDSSITVKHDLPEIKGAYVTSLALTTDKLIIQNGQSATVTVTALDLDTLPVANKSIKLYKDGTLLDTLTTDSNGQATKTITATSLAEISLVAKYQGTITSEELVINDTSLFDLSLTSSKDILQTSETATLTATLTGDDTGLAGETITFEVYHNDTLQETLTGTTDSNGVATASYTGKGTGALNIQAIIGERIISSITYGIIDAKFRDGGITSDNNDKWWSTQSTASKSIDSNGRTLDNRTSESGYSLYYVYWTDTLPSSWTDMINSTEHITPPSIIEFDLISLSNTNNISIFVGDANKGSFTNFGITANSHIKFVIDENNSCKCYIDGVLSSRTFDISIDPFNFAFSIPITHWVKFKNFLIYPL